MLAELLDAARRGHSGVLVLRGEPGIGKTALLHDLVERAPDFRVLSLSGAELERDMAYAGVQQLCAPLMSLIGGLPGPQADALNVALGLVNGAPPDRLLVGLALLTLLGAASGSSPLLCVVDDVQWVDSSSVQALAFVARRIQVDPVVMVFTTRDLGADALVGHRDLTLRGLSDRDARLLLATMVPARLDERVRETVLAEANGNPLALLELHKALAPEGLAGGYGLPSATSTESHIERTFVQQLHELPSATRTLLVVVAAEPAGRPEWIWSALDSLGIGREAAEPAETAGLIIVDRGPRFRHPLIRAAIYRSSSASQRRQAHAALASSITGPTADDYRAWHRAHATDSPDASIADELEGAAARARARGGVSAAASFLEYAARLTPDAGERARRTLDAAMANLDAGMSEPAARLIAAAYDSTDDELLAARCELLRAKMAFAASRGVDAPPLLLAAAKRLERLDPLESRKAYLGALMASILVGRLSTEQHNSAPSVAEAALRAPAAPDPPRVIDLLLDGLIVRVTRGYVAAAAQLQEAIRAYLREWETEAPDPRWHDLTARVCLDLFDQDAHNFLTAREVEQLRASGALTMLPVALVTYSGVCVTAGKFEQAAALLDESEAIITATGAPVRAAIRTYLAAYRGQEQLCRDGVRETIDGAVGRGEGYDISIALYSEAIMHNGFGRYQEAMEAAASGARYDDLGMCGYLLVELVEAAVRCKEHEIATEAFGRLRERTEASGTETALGVLARSTALMSDGSVADAAYQDALVHLERSPAVVYLARTHLLYGEWLRREKRRADARTQLRIAHDMFARMGADAFARRAQRELAATGETVSFHASDGAPDLTAQESRIALLARDGYTNVEIAGQLFISRRTVEWHLGKIFSKLGVTSRRELRTALGKTP